MKLTYIIRHLIKSLHNFLELTNLDVISIPLPRIIENALQKLSITDKNRENIIKLSNANNYYLQQKTEKN